MASQIGHAIDVSGENPTFRDWLRVVETEPARSLITMQLFDPDGKLLEHYGPVGIPKLLKDTTEFTENGQQMRIRQGPLLHKGLPVGYLQLELPTRKRTEVTTEFLITMSIMAPFVILGFAQIGKSVSTMAVKPIEQLVATLQRFVADAGHELNTPASIIQARAQSLERKLKKEGNKYEEDLQIISKSAERMGYIVKDLMLLAELDSKTQYKSESATDFKSVVESAIAEFGERFEDKDVLLQSEIIESANVGASQDTLRGIISNLLENALKYTQPNGLVTINCLHSTPTNEVRLIVKDTGIGIPADCLPYIFDRFYRVDQSRDRTSGGSGLGLAIVKALVETAAGHVLVESVPSEGTQFTVILPTAKVPVGTTNS
ncbi:MAG: HAMP domain-containing sensor histidine kinase [Candidatus Melainabacteria bacterium]|nr:HAMP domain-containing sensor histidine kinase [Candidatus Melainabacteria bacterium]